MSSQHDFPYTYEGLLQLLKRLRGPDGCPWDGEQTHESLKAQFFEECYELIEAIEQDDTQQMIEEIGDVFYHVLFQVDIAEKNGEFKREQVFRALIDKLVRRHPHVFDGEQVSGSDEVITNWQTIKQKEREGTDKSLLDGVPKQMPALAYANSVQERAARIGFDWDDFKGVLDKVTEELREINEARSDRERELELGDLLFSIVNVARWMDVDAESALRQANVRFYDRFVTMERLSRERSLSFAQLTLDEKETLWQEAKRMLGNQDV